MARSTSRFRVHLQVRYESASDFVREYADNLGAGGLFIAGAVDLEPLQEVPVEIDLPGAGMFRVTAQVAHVLTLEAAARIGRKAGAGLAIVKSPPGFADALAAYLMRLGRRADHLVLCGHDGIRDLLAGAGYQVAVVPAAAELAAVIARSEVPVVGVVVSSSQAEAYRAAAAAAGAPDIVHTMDLQKQIDSILANLDDSL